MEKLREGVHNCNPYDMEGHACCKPGAALLQFFSAAALSGSGPYQFMHPLSQPTLLHLDGAGNPVRKCSLALWLQYLLFLTCNVAM